MVTLNVKIAHIICREKAVMVDSLLSACAQILDLRTLVALVIFMATSSICGLITLNKLLIQLNLMYIKKMNNQDFFNSFKINLTVTH